MANGLLGTVLGHIRKLVGAGTRNGSDAYLLEQFAARRDEAAFEALVCRHGVLVWDVCRSVLGDAHDAEDAFQATFLVLASRAGSIRKQASVASWLYGVAQRIALKARAAAARRRVREMQAGTMAQPDPPAGSCDRELRSILHEELVQVPHRYRAPIVLFYLEGVPYEEVARQLGLPLGTVKSRLARGRDLLRTRLVRRGLALSAGLLTTALTGPTARAVPTALVLATIKAAVQWATGGQAAAGLASAQARVLAAQALRKMASVRLLVAMAILLTAGALAAGFGIILHQGTVDKPTAVSSPRAPGTTAPAVGQNLTVRADPWSPWKLSAAGRVIDDRNRPMVGVRVDLREWAVRRTDPQGPQVTDVLAYTFTNAHGHFTFKDVGAPLLSDALTMRLYPWDVVVIVPGRGLAWQQLTAHAQKQTLMLKLKPEARLQGRVMNRSGRPVTGARICVCGVTPLDKDDSPPAMNRWAGAGKSGGGVLNLYHSGIAPAATSDARGNFVLTGLPAEMRCTLHVTSADYVDQIVYAATTSHALPKLLDWSLNPIAVQTGPLRIRLDLGHPVRGLVLCADSQLPLPSADLRLRNNLTAYPATADAQGRFTFAHIPAGSYTLSIKDAGQPTDYLPVRCALEVPQTGNKAAIFRRPRGTRVSGRVVDADTGQGIAAVQVSCLLDQAGKVDGMVVDVPITRTDAQGRFRLTVPPGQGRLLAFAGHLRSGYSEQGERRLTFKRGQPLTDIRIGIRPDLVFTGQVVGPDSAPVPSARVGVENGNDSRFPYWAAVTDQDGKFRLPRVPRLPPYVWVAMHASRNLGARVMLPAPADAKSPTAITIRLQPLGAVAGRLVTGDGKPVAGAALTVGLQSKKGLVFNKPQAVPEADGLMTDQAGRFRFDQLLPIPGKVYTIEVRSPGYAPMRTAPFPAHWGQTRNLRAVVLLPADQSLAGQAVDRSGQPLANVRVQARPTGLTRDGSLFIGPDPVVTDSAGRFHFTGLPPGPVELSARALDLSPSKQSTSRVLTSRPVVAQAGRQNVAIVLTGGR